MNDLISRQAALKEAYKIVVEGDTYEVVQSETLMGLPFIDAEPVVRCKDCKHCDMGRCEIWEYVRVPDMGFCHEGAAQ